METKQFIEERAVATLSAQENIAMAWVWPYKTVAEWTTSINSFNAQEIVAIDAKSALVSMQGTVDMMMGALHEKTVKVLALLRTVVELTTPENINLVEMLSASGQSRAEVMDEAQDLASAWKRINPAWLPVTGLTLVSFENEMGDCGEALKEYVNARSNWRAEVGKWNSIAAGINRDCMAWYNDATHVFPAGTAEGDMIRSTVPTTTDLTPLPDQAELQLEAAPEPGSAAFILLAEHAAKFDVYEKAPGALEFTKVGVDVPPGLYVKTGLTPGDYEFKAAGMNSRGTGPESEPLAVAVV
jgi:hypothetical protein